MSWQRCSTLRNAQRDYVRRSPDADLLVGTDTTVPTRGCSSIRRRGLAPVGGVSSSNWCQRRAAVRLSRVRMVNHRGGGLVRCPGLGPGSTVVGSSQLSPVSTRKVVTGATPCIRMPNLAAGVSTASGRATPQRIRRLRA